MIYLFKLLNYWIKKDSFCIIYPLYKKCITNHYFFLSINYTNRCKKRCCIKLSKKVDLWYQQVGYQEKRGDKDRGRGESTHHSQIKDIWGKGKYIVLDRTVLLSLLFHCYFTALSDFFSSTTNLLLLFIKVLHHHTA